MAQRARGKNYVCSRTDVAMVEQEDVCREDVTTVAGLDATMRTFHVCRGG